MAIKAVLFDLDGTLLPMDQNAFLRGYFGLLTKTVVSRGYDGALFMQALLAGTDAMVKNTGIFTNEQMFWQTFQGFYPDGNAPDKVIFDDFYRDAFIGTKAFCGFDKRPRIIVDKVKGKGLVPVLATAPAFPAIATETRMGYVGLAPADFSLVTSYENSTYCKPSPDYYREVARAVGVAPEDCLMVGNDVTDDILPATEVGMQVFLLTEFLINKIDADIDGWPHGGYDDLLAYIEKM